MCGSISRLLFFPLIILSILTSLLYYLNTESFKMIFDIFKDTPLFVLLLRCLCVLDFHMYFRISLYGPQKEFYCGSDQLRETDIYIFYYVLLPMVTLHLFDILNFLYKGLAQFLFNLVLGTLYVLMLTLASKKKTF